MLLNEAIVMTTDEAPAAYRTRQADWWRNEARECDALGMTDLAADCLVNAAVWERETTVRWFEDGEP